MPTSCDVAVVGGGASGLACAIACAQEAARLGRPRPRIVILEAARRIGASIMRSGNGRCNFSNAHIDVSRYRNADFVAQTLDACAADAHIPSVLDWFEALGLVWSEQRDSGGLLYPFSRKANSVLDVLRRSLDELGVSVCVDARVESARRDGGETILSVRVGGGSAASGRRPHDEEPARIETLRARSVVIAAGGTCDELLLSGLGVSPAESRRPVLGPLEATRCAGASCASLDGIRVQACVSVPARGFVEEGEVLFRPYGVSGIVVFNASRYAEPGDAMVVDLVPSLSESELAVLLERRVALVGDRRAQAFMDGFLLASLARAVLDQAGVSSDGAIDSASVRRIGDALKAFVLTLGGVADERACQVTRGGVQPCAVDPATLRVRNTPGVYVIGEALDVDGPCGGYNLHWAWTSGIAAGVAIAREHAKGRA